MRSINELNDQEVARVIQAIRRRAKKEFESIKTVKDVYRGNGYMVIDNYRNVIIDGGLIPLDLEQLAERYDVVY